MPVETKQAVEWALSQTVVYSNGEEIEVTKHTKTELVDMVREYFNSHNIEYSTFSYDDLIPYID